VWDGHVDGLRLSILDAHGSAPKRLTWEDGEGKAIETHISEIVVEPASDGWPGIPRVW